MKKSVEELVADIESAGNTLNLNGVSYKFNKFRHKERVKVFAFVSSIAPAMQAGNFSFLSSEPFEAIERLISDNVTIDGMALSKKPDHWEDNAENYIPFFAAALQFIPFPLLRGGVTN